MGRSGFVFRRDPKHLVIRPQTRGTMSFYEDDDPNMATVKAMHNRRGTDSFYGSFYEGEEDASAMFMMTMEDFVKGIKIEQGEPCELTTKEYTRTPH